MIPVKLKKILLILLCFFISTTLLSAQDEEENEETIPSGPQYILGDSFIHLNLGTFIPLFFQYVHDGSLAEYSDIFLGIKGSFQIGTYITNRFTLSIVLDGGMLFDTNFVPLWVLPIMAKATYIIYALGLEFPLSLGTGIFIGSYKEGSRIDFVLKPELGLLWQFDPHWCFGINVGYYWVPHIASVEQEAHVPHQSVFGNYLDISISTVYHF